MENIAAQHDGIAYDQYKLTVHNIIIRNIANGYNTYTYVKPHINRYDGSRDIKALWGRYENAAMNEQYVNKFKRTLETVAYTNEGAMKFEKFVAKFTQAVDE